MKMTIETDLTNFSRGMAGYVDRLGLQGPVVLRKETGELAKTLIRLTPPRDPDKTRKSIESGVRSKFSELEISTQRGSQMGKGEVTWYAANSRYLFGVEADKDMTKAGVEELRGLYYTLKRVDHGEHRRIRQILPFRNRNTRQQVALLQNVFTKKSTRTALIAKIKNNIGRLKAGWLVGYDRLRPGGGNQPPAWVTRHRSGARGWFIDAAATKNFPSFTIANTAVGVGNPKNNLTGIVRAAIGLRVKAMKANLALLLSGKKNLSDYARP
jgi:hypothetical protein